MNIGEMQRKLSCQAEAVRDHKFGDLYSLLCRMDWLRLAHDYVEQNAGSKTAGCDNEDMKSFNEEAEGNLHRIQEGLRTETFDASAVRRVYIPKAGGKMRPLGIPSIRDRIVQEAVRMILEPIYEADFSQYSFGFRPNRCTMDAIKCILWNTQEHKKYFWVIEGDISSYFDTINHSRLMNLLRNRIKDAKLLNLIWKVLRAGVMERGRYDDTIIGTPQGGIVSPLLANVYIHELDRYMERYAALPQAEKTARRKRGEANFAYVRYADDFVVLCNGTRGHAEAMREELRSFLASDLRLTLSMEKTKVTHLNDGFDFLGFTVRRSMGQARMGTKVLVSAKSMSKHMDKIRAACSPTTHEDSVATKIKALNRIIAGWCRYFQYTSKTSDQFSELEYKTFWCFAHWLGRKYKKRMTEVLREFNSAEGLGLDKLRLTGHADFSSATRTYAKRFLKPNPYTTQEATEGREELPSSCPWLGYEKRPGAADLREKVMVRDGFACKVCKELVTPDTCEVDHILPYSHYKRPVDANRLENLWTLCKRCHREKTEMDRRMESRMR